ncbi:MAG: response regulator [Candidatus Eisenbacteria bacterium]
MTKARTRRATPEAAAKTAPARRTRERLPESATAAHEQEQVLRRQIEALTQLNRELAFARDMAEASSRAKSEFLATVSQEIRTPMQGLVGTLDLLVDSSLGGEAADLAETAQAASNALVAIVNDLVDFASNEPAQALAEPVPFDLRQLVEDVASRFTHRASERGVELVVQWGEETPARVIGDDERVRTLLLQVVDNAVKFTERGHVLIGVDAAVATEADLLARITVEDTGCGIGPERLPLLFTHHEPGLRRHEAGAAHSGLLVARQLAERMGGTIIASSRLGEGSRFTITFKLARDVEGADGADGSVAQAARSALTHVHALVVDDVAVHRMVMQRHMNAFGMRAEAAPDGATALQMAREAAAAGDPFKLLLVDQNMPGMTGEQLGRLVREDETIGRVAMMLFTATANREEMRKFARAGFDGYFLKPIRPSELEEALTAVLRSKRRGTPRLELVPAAPQAPSHPRPHAGHRVLLVEDNAINQKVGRRMLEKLGCAVDVASNGLEALQQWGVHTYDAVFMDCDMPVMNGFDATLEIRRHEADNARRTPIVALTASVLPSDRERCLAAGMDDFVAKPVREDALDAVLGSVFGAAV